MFLLKTQTFGLFRTSLNDLKIITEVLWLTHPIPNDFRLIFPYRRELLTRFGLPFRVVSPTIGAACGRNAGGLRTGAGKTDHRAQLSECALIIGADQVATVNGEQIGKAGGFDKATAQLQMMRGKLRCFTVLYALYDARNDTYQLDNIVTKTTFRDLSDEELAAYLRIEQPL